MRNEQAVQATVYFADHSMKKFEVRGPTVCPTLCLLPCWQRLAVRSAHASSWLRAMLTRTHTQVDDEMTVMQLKEIIAVGLKIQNVDTYALYGEM
eukprot:SAG22_NODE_2265_length_2771_cov_2.301647_2_plen_95_part_00